MRLLARKSSRFIMWLFKLMPWTNRSENKFKNRRMWTARYEANELPESATLAWTPTYTPNPLVASTVEINPVGILHELNPAESDESWEHVINPEFSNATGLTVEFRMRVVSGELIAGENPNAGIGIYNELVALVIDIYTDGIGDNNDATKFYAFDTTDAYHTYRITIKDSVYKVYVDGTLRMEKTVDAGEFVPQIDLYHNSTTGNSERNWDYIYWKTNGAVAP